MSVLEYIYPADLEALSLERVSKELVLAIPSVAVAEVDRRRRAKPDWSSFSVAHKANSQPSSLVVCTQLSAATRRQTATRYRGNRNLTVVAEARKLIWTQYRGKARSQLKLLEGFNTHYLVLSTILRLCRGVIELPENERLYTTQGFSRHRRRRRIEHGSA